MTNGFFNNSLCFSSFGYPVGSFEFLLTIHETPTLLVQGNDLPLEGSLQESQLQHCKSYGFCSDYKNQEFYLFVKILLGIVQKA